MKVAPFFITLIIAAASLVLSIMLFFAGNAATELQTKLAAQNRTIQQGASSAQIYKNLLSDLARLSLQHPKIKDLLEKNGYHVERRANPEGAQNEPAPVATPEAAPEATPEATATPLSSRAKTPSKRSR